MVEIPKISRRNLIKGAAIGTVLGTLGGKHELQVLTQGYFEADGVRYQPLLEEHHTGPTEKINPNADAIFFEFNVISQRAINAGYKPTAENIGTILEENAKNVPNTKELIETVKNNHTVVGTLGDIGEAFEDKFFESKKLPFIIKDSVIFYAGLETALVAKKYIQRKPSPPANGTNINRREFLKRLAVGGIGAVGIWTTSGTNLFSDLTAGVSVKAPKPINQFLEYVNDIATTLHPENPFIFPRNALMALKIKMMGKYMKSIKEHPFIAYNTGYAHSGIKYFIPLPEEMLRDILIYISQQHLVQAMGLYGHDIASVQLIRYAPQGWEDVKKLTDTPLLKSLNEILDTTTRGG